MKSSNGFPCFHNLDNDSLLIMMVQEGEWSRSAETALGQKDF